uniref:Uncharacterized protein n=1 Tax=Candidatus Kentrum sp. TC TaxID=2126339 RepID=A0A450YTE2_9GAMM|nr:MAG: hypothetical protein BECKTC1821E_GA0114239_103918 [Candidatus Kentron sp. TC]
MIGTQFKWSRTEKVLARRVFDKAYKREMEDLTNGVRAMLADNADGWAIWRIQECLSEQRYATDNKYDYRYSVLISVFGRLLGEGRIHATDIEGLGEDKLEQIRSIADFIRKR